ncbi:unnamed protein product [Brachionus calyciflorus]|uniref:Voltage-gated potassium channel subunit beta-1 n=1 Tax=Brachionus calyciflorus TaxID=104777 RepID=A0A814JHI1_9BILA|nr:unnamed protein product [Brachionus calyciflorus]
MSKNGIHKTNNNDDSNSIPLLQLNQTTCLVPTPNSLSLYKNTKYCDLIKSKNYMFTNSLGDSNSILNFGLHSALPSLTSIPFNNSSIDNSNTSLNELKLTIQTNNSPTTPIIHIDSEPIDNFFQASNNSTTPLMTSFLQQQNSLELTPFKKKDIHEDTSAFNSFKTDVTYLDSHCVTSSSNNQEQLKIYQQTFKQLPNGNYIKLRYKNLGKSGLRVSQLGLGTWVTFGSQISDETAEDILTTAYENGINIFETCEVYAGGKAELTLGRILKKKNWRRSSYIICIKIYLGGKAETEKGLSRKHIIEGVRASLDRLQLDYVDIAFANKPDALTPMEEIVRAFTHLINTDKCFYWGTSRWNSTEIMEAYSVARQFNLIPPICEQSEYNLFQREQAELYLPELYSRIGLGTMAWSPLASGFITGKYEYTIPHESRAALRGYGWLKERIQSDDGKKKQAKLKELQSIADKLNCTLAQLALAWCLKNETVNCVLLGASTVEQLIENIQSIQVVPKLTLALMNEIDKILGNKPALLVMNSSKSDNLHK